jgi:hypothetical protein
VRDNLQKLGLEFWYILNIWYNKRKG